MALDKFKPEVWAEEIVTGLDPLRVFYENTNHAYEGIAKKVGDTIKILGIGKPTIGEWTDGKLHKLDEPEDIEDNSMFLTMKHVAHFNIGMDDLDKEQSKKGTSLLSLAIQEAREEIAAKQDAFIAGLVKDKQVAKHTVTSKLTKSSILDAIDAAYQMLLENNVSRATHVTLTAPPWFTMMLRRAYVELDTANSGMMENGKVGKYGGITIKESTQVYNDGTYDNIQLKTDRAIAFVNPHTQVESYRPEKEFKDAMKGFSLYDGKVVRPKEIINLQVKNA